MNKLQELEFLLSRGKPSEVSVSTRNDTIRIVFNNDIMNTSYKFEDGELSFSQSSGTLTVEEGIEQLQKTLLNIMFFQSISYSIKKLADDYRKEVK